MSSYTLRDTIETQILHTTTTRTLHAHNFSKTSSRAIYTLTDLLSRYILLLSETCARYAQHAGRTGVTVRDAISALEEMGVGMDELRDYVEGGEPRELVRYTAQTAKRAEELAEVKAAVRDGIFHDPDNDISLVYAPFEEDYTSDEDEEEEEEEVETPIIKTEPHSTAMQISEDNSDSPLSPLSPPRKRPRLGVDSSEELPDYVPWFFPRFPGSNDHMSVDGDDDVEGSVAPIPLLDGETLVEDAEKKKPQADEDEVGKDIAPTQHLPVRQPSPALPNSTSTTSSYLTNIPYEHSSLSTTPEWHLPKSAHSLPVPTSTTPTTLPSLISSYSYLQSTSLSSASLTGANALTSSSSSSSTNNPLHHALAMMLVGLSSRAWSPAPTLFGASGVGMCGGGGGEGGGGAVGGVPRRAAFLPAFAVPLDKNGKPVFTGGGGAAGAGVGGFGAAGAGAGAGIGPNGLQLPPQDWLARSVAGSVAVVEPTTMQGSRIPYLARATLSQPVLLKSTRMVAPPPLERNGQKLFYGPPIPAPWNYSAAASGGGAEGSRMGGGSSGKALGGSGTAGSGAGASGKDKDGDEDEAGVGGGSSSSSSSSSKILAEAHLLATWDYDTKDFRYPLGGVPKRGSKVGGVSLAAGAGPGAGASGNGVSPGVIAVTSSKRKRSESMLGF